MKTPTEPYADLLPGDDDPVMARNSGAVDHALTATSSVLSRKAAIKASMTTAGAAWLLVLGHTSSAIAGDVANLVHEGPMSSARLVDILLGERARWDALLARVGPARMDLPGVEGTWSVKQIVAHLTWYEGVIVEGARQLMSTGMFVRDGLRAVSMDERNAILADQSRVRPVHDVLAESRRIFEQLVGVLAACPDDILNDPRRLGLPDGVAPWTLVANNSYAHYQQHARTIQTWLDE